MAALKRSLSVGVLLKRSLSYSRAGSLLPGTSSTRFLCQCNSYRGVQLGASPSWSVWRGYAKKAKKEKVAAMKGKKRLDLSAEEVSTVIDLHKFKDKMQAVVDNLKQEYIHNLSLRTSIGSFDHLMVATPDGDFPLNQLGQLVQKNPTLLMINLAMSPQYIPMVMKAIEQSGMNVRPQQEVNTIFIPVPKVSREHREGLAKSAKKLCDQAKERLRDIHKKASKEVHKPHESVSSDLLQDVQTLVLDTMHDYMEQLDKILVQKKAELLGEK